MTREAWLNRLTDKLRPLFIAAGAPLPPKVRISCGWPTRKPAADAKGVRALGQCFSRAASAAGINEVFVSPVVADAQNAAAILVHELVHAADDCANGHGAAFKRIATAVGLAGPMRSTTAGPELENRLNALIAELGPYPHARLDYNKDRKKQTTRMLKLVCPECGYTVRTTRQWIEQGLPTCPCGEEFTEDGGAE